MAPQREAQHAHRHSKEAVGEIGEHGIEIVFERRNAVGHDGLDQLAVLGNLAFVLEAPQRCRDQIEIAQDIGHAARDLLLALERPAQHHRGPVRGEREGLAIAMQLAIPMRHRPLVGCAGKGAIAHPVQEAGHHIAQHEARMPAKGHVELLQPRLAVRVLARLHFLEQIGMRTQHALGKGHQRAGQDIGPFHRDGHRQRHIGAEQVIARPVLDGAAAMDVKGIVHAVAHGFGGGVFEEARNHRRALALVHHRGSQPAAGLEGIGALDHFAERLGDAFHQPHRNAELAAHPRIGGRRAQRLLDRDRADCRQRDGAARRQALHQHAPALAGIIGAADQIAHGHEHIGAAHRPVHEGLARGEVPAADIEARMIARDQRQRNADIRAATEQVVGVLEQERQAHQRGNRRQGNVALVKAQRHAERFLAFPHALGHHADIAHATGVGARMHARQRKAGHFKPARQPAEVFFLLLRRAVFFQQLARPERIGHHHRDTRRHRAAGDLGDDHRLRLRREAQAAMLLGNQHAQEAFVLEVLPELGRQVRAIVADIPVVDHLAGGFGLVVQERLFIGRQRQRPYGAQLAPVGPAGKQLGIPAHRAGIERFLFGAAHLGQDGFDRAIDRGDQHRHADGLDAQRQQDQPRQQRQHQPDPAAKGKARAEVNAAEKTDHQCAHAPLPHRALAHGQHGENDQTDNDSGKDHSMPSSGLPRGVRAAQSLNVRPVAESFGLSLGQPRRDDSATGPDC